MLKLGQLKLNVPFFQASLSGYSDYAMRKLARQYGAPLTFAGVMLAKSAADEKMLRKAAFRPEYDEHPVGAQILGRRPDVMAEAAKGLVDAGYDVVGLNFACPAPKILRRKRGGYLLAEPERIVEILRSVRKAVNCPVTMKLRIGFDNTDKSLDNFYRICRSSAAEGADALVIHGRTVVQKYHGSADWKVITNVKHSLPGMTIVGSGDMLGAVSAAERLQVSQVDGVSIARGAIGNPWIFRRLRAMLQGEPVPDLPKIDELGRVMLKHLDMVSGLYEGKKAVAYFRKFLVNYCKLHPERKKVQAALISIDNRRELVKAIKDSHRI